MRRLGADAGQSALYGSRVWSGSRDRGRWGEVVGWAGAGERMFGAGLVKLAERRARITRSDEAHRARGPMLEGSVRSIDRGGPAKVEIGSRLGPRFGLGNRHPGGRHGSGRREGVGGTCERGSGGAPCVPDGPGDRSSATASGAGGRGVGDGLSGAASRGAGHAERSAWERGIVGSCVFEWDWSDAVDRGPTGATVGTDGQASGVSRGGGRVRIEVRDGFRSWVWQRERTTRSACMEAWR